MNKEELHLEAIKLSDKLIKVSKAQRIRDYETFLYECLDAMEIAKKYTQEEKVKIVSEAITILESK